MKNQEKIKTNVLIVGAGPAGLGAAWHLHKLKRSDWLLCEKEEYAGGLAASFVDNLGFTWDVGGHVQFSHYEYFDNAMAEFLPSDQWLEHNRESWVYMDNRYIPYPFQYNIHRLEKAKVEDCLLGLLELPDCPGLVSPNFNDWIYQTFGRGIAEHFLVPYNTKVWSYRPEQLNAKWVGERVAVPDIKRVLRNVIHNKDDVSWGPNNKFKFPAFGGTGQIWRQCFNLLPLERTRLSAELVEVQPAKHLARFSNGLEVEYESLISTIPLTLLQIACGFGRINAAKLLHSSSHIFGIALSGRPSDDLLTKCWMYFPEDNCPFYRATVFSNYSPRNVPDSSKHWSLMLEVSESLERPKCSSRLLDDVISGLLATQLIRCKSEVLNVWRFTAPYGYPTPSIGRDDALSIALPDLERYKILSRGRFGAWRYEVSNQDHSFMQGVEAVEYLINGVPETTLNHAGVVNGKRNVLPAYIRG